MVPNTSADALREALDAVPGLAQRFPRSTEDTDETDETYETDTDDVGEAVYTVDEEVEADPGEADAAEA